MQRNTQKYSVVVFICLFHSVTSDIQLNHPRAHFAIFPVKNFSLFHKVPVALWTQPKQNNQRFDSLLFFEV